MNRQDSEHSHRFARGRQVQMLSRGSANNELPQPCSGTWPSVSRDAFPDRRCLLSEYADVKDELTTCLVSLDFIQQLAPEIQANATRR